MAYDPKCYELAEHFLPTGAPDRLKSALAQVVQDAVEDAMLTKSPDVDDQQLPSLDDVRGILKGN